MSGRAPFTALPVSLEAWGPEAGGKIGAENRIEAYPQETAQRG